MAQPSPLTDRDTQPAVCLHGLQQKVIAIAENRHFGRFEVFQIVPLLDVLVMAGQVMTLLTQQCREP